jgi:hypothetical protein
VVTKRSGQAQTALISRRPATVERTPGRRPPRKGQDDNKSSTNRRPDQTDSDSQTKRVKSFGRLGPSGSLGRLATLLFARPPRTKRRQINDLPNHRSAGTALFHTSSDVKSDCRIVAGSDARCADPGRGRRKRGTKGAGISDAARPTIRRRRAIPIRPPGALSLRHGRQSVPPSVASLARSGTRRREPAQRRPESATRRVVRFAGRKAIPIRATGVPP